jgi:hypothetical protein
MSSIINTKRALERRLKNNFPSTQIAFENVDFKPPTNSLYLQTQLVVLQPEDVVIGSKYYRERFSFQVFVVDLLSKGTTNAISIAEQIRTLFDKGTFLEESGSRIHVWTTPRIDSADVVEQRLIVPVIIAVTTEVYKD